eukprot:gene30898-41120_t
MMMMEVVCADCFCGYFTNYEDALHHEVAQVSKSGCGVTAILNVLVTFRIIENIYNVTDVDTSTCILRVRDNDAPLTQYLQSRSIAGCTGEDLVASMQSIFLKNPHFLNGGDHVIGSFESFKDFTGLSKNSHGPQLIEAIAERLKNSEVLIATLNLQLLGNDAWHHQMIYGVDTQSRQIHCMNPVGSYPEDIFISMLSTDSVLLIRREDILLRAHRPGSDWDSLNTGRWKQLHVTQQISKMLRERDTNYDVEGPTSHILIPANYIGGITCFKLIRT